MASKNGNIDIVKFLAKKEANVNTQDIDGKTPLFYAASQHHLQVVKYLLSKAAKPRLHSTQGETPLHACVIQPPRNFRGAEGETMDALKTAGSIWESDRATLSDADNNGDTPLIRAIKVGNANSNMVQRLVEMKSDLLIENNDGKAAMQIAQDGMMFAVIAVLEEAYSTQLFNRAKQEAADEALRNKRARAGAAGE